MHVHLLSLSAIVVRLRHVLQREELRRGKLLSLVQGCFPALRGVHKAAHMNILELLHSYND